MQTPLSPILSWPQVGFKIIIQPNTEEEIGYLYSTPTVLESSGYLQYLLRDGVLYIAMTLLTNWCVCAGLCTPGYTPVI